MENSPVLADCDHSIFLWDQHGRVDGVRMSLDLVEEDRSGGLGPRMDLSGHGLNSPADSVFLLPIFPVARQPVKDQLTPAATVRITVVDAAVRAANSAGRSAEISVLMFSPYFGIPLRSTPFSFKI